MNSPLSDVILESRICLALDGHVIFVNLMKHILVDLVLVGSNASKAITYTTHMLMVYTVLVYTNHKHGKSGHGLPLLIFTLW